MLLPPILLEFLYEHNKFHYIFISWSISPPQLKKKERKKDYIGPTTTHNKPLQLLVKISWDFVLFRLSIIIFISNHVRMASGISLCHKFCNGYLFQMFKAHYWFILCIITFNMRFSFCELLWFWISSPYEFQ